MARQPDLFPVISARVPLSISEAGRVHVFRPEDGGEEHYAVEIGTPDRPAPVLARLCGCPILWVRLSASAGWRLRS